MPDAATVALSGCTFFRRVDGVFGRKPERQKASALVGGWQKMLGSVVTQHLLGPIEVASSGKTATAECHVQATHEARGDEWVVQGHYVFSLDRVGGGGWAIARMKLETYRQTGNAELLAQASADGSG